MKTEEEPFEDTQNEFL
jgi:hypothetical protein